MKALQLNLLLLPCLMLLTGACRSAEEAASPAPAEAGEGTYSYTPEHQEARRLYGSLQGPLEDAGLQVVLRGDTLEAQGSSRDQFHARILMTSFDSPSLTPDRRIGTWEFEHRDARMFMNSARGLEAWGEGWVAVALSNTKLYASVPGGSTAALSRLVAEYDRAD